MSEAANGAKSEQNFVFVNTIEFQDIKNSQLFTIFMTILFLAMKDININKSGSWHRENDCIKPPSQ